MSARVRADQGRMSVTTDMRRVRHARVRAGERKTQRPAMRVVVFLSTHETVIRTVITHTVYMNPALSKIAGTLPSCISLYLIINLERAG